jgi:hypothetical protein
MTAFFQTLLQFSIQQSSCHSTLYSLWQGVHHKTRHTKKVIKFIDMKEYIGWQNIKTSKESETNRFYKVMVVLSIFLWFRRNGNSISANCVCLYSHPTPDSTVKIYGGLLYTLTGQSSWNSVWTSCYQMAYFPTVVFCDALRSTVPTNIAVVPTPRHGSDTNAIKRMTLRETSINIIRVVKSGRMKWTRHEARMGRWEVHTRF